MFAPRCETGISMLTVPYCWQRYALYQVPSCYAVHCICCCMFVEEEQIITTPCCSLTRELTQCGPPMQHQCPLITCNQCPVLLTTFSYHSISSHSTRFPAVFIHSIWKFYFDPVAVKKHRKAAMKSKFYIQVQYCLPKHYLQASKDSQFVLNSVSRPEVPKVRSEDPQASFSGF